MFQIRQDPGDPGFVFAAELTELCGGEPFRMTAQVVKAHDMSSFKPKRAHVIFLDFLDAFINPGDSGGKLFKSLNHKNLVFTM